MCHARWTCPVCKPFYELGDLGYGSGGVREELSLTILRVIIPPCWEFA